MHDIHKYFINKYNVIVIVTHTSYDDDVCAIVFGRPVACGRYSWMLGRELADPFYGEHPERFAPWHSARTVALFPCVALV